MNRTDGTSFRSRVRLGRLRQDGGGTDMSVGIERFPDMAQGPGNQVRRRIANGEQVQKAQHLLGILDPFASSAVGGGKDRCGMT